MSEKEFIKFIENYDDVINDSLYSKEDDIEIIQNSLYKNKIFEIESSLNFEKELKKFYEVILKWKIKWKTIKESKVDLEGSINILPIEEVLIVDVDFLPNEFPIMKNFTLLDYFYPEAAVGFYLNKPENGLYLHLFDGITQKLNLDFKGYLEMLKYTRGVVYWQLAVVKPMKKTSNTIEKLNKIFPEITVKGFFELYEKVRINKQ